MDEEAKISSISQIEASIPFEDISSLSNLNLITVGEGEGEGEPPNCKKHIKQNK